MKEKNMEYIDSDNLYSPGQTNTISCWSDRPGRMCKSDPVKTRDAVGNIRKNSICQGPACVLPASA